MLGAGHHGEVLNAVVPLVLVDVMDVFVSEQRSSQMGFHHKPVGFDFPAVAFGVQISGPATLGETPAFRGAVLATSAGGIREGTPAPAAEEVDLTVVGGPLPSDGGKPGRLVDLGLAQAAARTEPDVVPLESVGLNQKGCSAMFADTFDGHAVIVQAVAIAGRSRKGR